MFLGYAEYFLHFVFKKVDFFRGGGATHPLIGDISSFFRLS